MGSADFRKMLDLARQAGRNRDYNQAITILTELVRQTDEYPEAVLFLGRSYHAIGQYDRAAGALQFFLKLQPESPPAHFFIGRTYCALGLYRRAIKHLKHVLSLSPNFIPALPFLGLALLKLKRPDLALPFFEKAVAAVPRNKRIYAAYLNTLMVHGIRLFNRNDPDMARQVFEFLVKQKDDFALPYIYLAIISRETGDLESAARYYDEVIRIQPDDPTFRLHKAQLYLKMGRNSEAVHELGIAQAAMGEDFKIAAQAGLRDQSWQDPGKLLKLIAVTHYRAGRLREAIYFAKQVLKANYRDVDMHMLIAEAYSRFNEFEKARNHYLRALEQDRTHPGILQGLCMALWELGEYPQLLERAKAVLRIYPDDADASYFQVIAMAELDTPAQTLIPLLQEEIRRQGPDAHLMFCLGRAYFTSSRKDLAEGWLVRTLKLEEDHADALLYLSEVYEHLQNRKAQRETLKTYIKFYADDVPERKKYVRLLLADAMYREAGEQLSSLLTLEPKNTVIKKTLGVCYQRSGNYVEAILVWKELIRQEPKSIPNLRQLIYCFDRLGNRLTAIKILQSAVKYLKETSDLLLPLGVLYVKERDYERATSIFRHIIDSNPRDWRAYFNLGMVYKKQKNKAFADRFIEKAMELRAQIQAKAASKAQAKPHSKTRFKAKPGSR
ncbi:MAG: hypothetical protein EHM28_05315 [Spirochaetaceae bacterium]|nr:MAG: hypothetical protein EHM28_05315 [Spirochaetaceae bacterium]